MVQRFNSPAISEGRAFLFSVQAGINIGDLKRCEKMMVTNLALERDMKKGIFYTG